MGGMARLVRLQPRRAYHLYRRAHRRHRCLAPRGQTAAVNRRQATSGGYRQTGEARRKKTVEGDPAGTARNHQDDQTGRLQTLGGREREGGVRWNMSWTVVRDVLLTGTGVTVILIQAFSPHPSDVALATGLALTIPSAYGHTAALLGRGAGSSSPQSSEPPSSPPISPQEAGSR